jgi:uncharacterized protein
MKRFAALLIALAAPAFAEPDVPCPLASAPVADLGNVLGAAAEERIAGTCRALQEQKGVPLVVVTVPSLGGVTVETLALRLLAQWQFDAVETDGRNWQKGILLLVAPQDKKCRIELGTAWGTARYPECRKITDDWLRPRFRSGAFEAGIEDGVAALDSMARGTKPRSAPRTSGSWFVPLGLVALAVFTIVSTVRRGTQGAAWSFWRVVFSVLGTILVIVLTPRRRRGGFGGFGYIGGRGGFGYGGSYRSSWSGGGGSRGGGGGGGRGATGSW